MKEQQLYRFIKNELRQLHKMSIKGVSVANETISTELVTEINHFMAVLLTNYTNLGFKADFDI